MNFIEFLNQAKNKSFWEKQTTICFVGQEYPFLFFNNLFWLLQEKTILPAPYRPMLLESTEETKLKSHLKQSFLGQKTFYWLGECEAKETGKNKFKTFDFLINYKGPNFIALFLNEEKISSKISTEIKKIISIKLETFVNESLFKKIAEIFDKSFSKEKFDLMKKLLTQVQNIQLDQTYLLMQYLESISTKTPQKAYEYLFSISTTLKPELSSLSHYFFTKQAKLFFAAWSKIYKDYPEIFWITFWAEQIWKAYHVTKFLKENNFAKAKALSFRLPFSFLKTDWKTFSLNELENLFQFIYTNDFKLKNGSIFCFLDLFYLNHFLGNFSLKGI